MSRNTLILEQINLGELDSNRYSDDNLFQKLGEIQKSNEEILSQYPAEKIKALVEERLANKTGLKSSEEKIPVNPVFRKHLNIQKIAGIAAIACLAIMLPFMLTQKPANTGAISLEQSISQNAKERTKGVSSIFVYKKTDDSVLRLKNKAIEKKEQNPKEKRAIEQHWVPHYDNRMCIIEYRNYYYDNDGYLIEITKDGTRIKRDIQLVELNSKSR